MSGEGFTNGNRVIYILVFVAMGLGSFNTINGTTNESQFDKLQTNFEHLLAGLDETLQREMRLLTAPLDDRVHHNTDMIEEIRHRTNTNEADISELKAQMEILLEERKNG